MLEIIALSFGCIFGLLVPLRFSSPFGLTWDMLVLLFVLMLVLFSRPFAKRIANMTTSHGLANTTLAKSVRIAMQHQVKASHRVAIFSSVAVLSLILFMIGFVSGNFVLALALKIN